MGKKEEWQCYRETEASSMIYRFGNYELDLHLYQLRHTGQPLKVEPKVFDVLAYLVQRRDSVVSKDDILTHIWPDQYISEATLSGCIMAARKAVGDSGRTQRVIQTAHGRGYRFVAPVTVEPATAPSAGGPSARPEAPEQAESHALKSPEIGLPALPQAELTPEALPSAHSLPPGSEIRRCPLCQHENSAAATFCTACGTRLMQSCPQCTHPVPLPAAFCLACGQRLEEPFLSIVPSSTYPRSRFVGREQELALLYARLLQAEAGHGQVVGLVGEPAIGKSWLLNEFRRRLGERPVTYVEGRCRPYPGVVSSAPLCDLVRQCCDITGLETAEAITLQVRQHLQQLDLDAAAGVPYVLHLLGIQAGTEPLARLSPETLRLRTFVTLRQLFLAQSRQRPLIVAVEDSHWLDPTSEDILASLIDSLANVPILLLVTFRPEFRPPWLAAPYATTIELPPLAPQDSLRLVQSVLPQERATDPLVQAILARAAGNPFFIEELSRAVIEQRILESEVAMPDTIRGVLMARLDYLPDEPRRLLQTAAVLGRTVSLRLLVTIYEGAGGLDASLLELERRGLCYEQRGAQEPTYVFKHDLLQDVAYKSLLPARRRALHTAVAEALEAYHAEQLEPVYALLAYHYGQAVQANKAIAYLRQMAEQAAQRYAHAEALLVLQEALDHVTHLPAAAQHSCRFELLLRQAQSLLALGRSRDVETLLLPQQAVLAELQDARLAGRVALLLSRAAQHLGQWPAAAQYAQQAIETATAGHDAATCGQAHQVLAMERYWAGEPGTALEHSQQAVALLDQPPLRSQLGMAYVVLGLNMLLLGDFERAVAAEVQADAIGEAHGELSLRAFAAWATGWIQTTYGAWEAGMAACQRALEYASDPLNVAFALGWLGYAHLEQGQVEEALLLLGQASEQMRQFQYRRLEGLYTVFLGEAHLLRGEVDKAYDRAQQGLDMVTAAEYRFGIGWAQRALGKIALADGAVSEAETRLQQALDTFAAMSARFELARTHLALARLAYHQDHHGVATEQLAQAHRLFIDLSVPTYVERTVQDAQELGLSLSTAKRC